MASGVTALQERQIHRVVLNNGIVVLATENPTADIISTRMFLRAGSRWETSDQAGISHLVATVLTKGTDQLSSQDIAERVESVGASLGTDAGTDYFLLSLKTVTSDFPDILNLAGQLLRSASFPEPEVELERHLTLQAIRSQQEQPFTLALDQFRQALYRHHPYALSPLGTFDSVSRLNRDALVAYHQTYFRPDNLVISLCGRIAPEAAIALIEETFGDWEKPASDLPYPLIPELDFAPATVTRPLDTQQSIVMLGYPAASVRHPDYATLKLLNTYLGNGLSSRLFVELREKRGLAYEVSAFYPTRLDTSQFAMYMGTAPDNTVIALEGMYQEIDRLRTTLLSDSELQSAKNKLLGQYALGKQTNAQVAHLVGWYEALGLGLEFDTQFQEQVAAVTPEMAQIAASQHFTTPYISLVGPPQAIGQIAP
ncbi:MAG: pitrilysin family protein [Leptolyngbyaceae cyanobacterium bins.59]|nr:pitrilysin family protein [Leptolyngbyaceae cyanobacterium bins.59]